MRFSVLHWYLLLLSVETIVQSFVVPFKLSLTGRVTHHHLEWKEITASSSFQLLSTATDKAGRSLVNEGEDKLIENLNNEILQATGVPLEELINPSKVVNLKRDILKLQEELSNCKDVNSKLAIELQEKLNQKQKVYFTESRAVMKSWLKNLFVIQSVIAGIISYAMVTNTIPGYSLPLSVQVLGVWMWWLFIIPSLRARKPTAQEKDALNISFILNPLVTLVLPFYTKDTLCLWVANLITFSLCYVYGFLKPSQADDSNENNPKQDDNNTASILTKVWKALDYGSGQERGRRH